ncbi:MAG: signal peptidase I [Sedimentisphaerales bacterium]|nr:signal peptidase I [Sedimentisphaerales bacterium]
MNDNQEIGPIPSEPKERRRHPWLAVLLSLLLPGLGQVYCGKIINGITIMFIVAWFPFAWMMATLKTQEVTMSMTLFFLGIALLAMVVAAIDAYRQARRIRPEYRLKDYNHWAVYAILILINTGASFGYAGFLRDRIIQAFSVPTHSMYPTIHSGDRILAGKQAYLRADPQRGDIVLFPNPQERKQAYVKRVVALAGDTVEIRNDRLAINGEPLALEPVSSDTAALPHIAVSGQIFWENNGTARYKIFLGEPKEEKSRTSANFGPIVVPPYHCFVMGDNRNFSSDSRHFGPIAVASIRGKFTYCYFPADDWSRLGPLE